jgi:predicted small secreted protein
MPRSDDKGARAGVASKHAPMHDLNHLRAHRSDAFIEQPARERLMTRFIALLLLAGTTLLAACNTMAGAGQDISKGGNAITNSAEKHSD